MQVSMSTGCLYHLPPDQIADAAAEAGFGHVEVLLNPDLMERLDEMARALETRGLQATVAHAPFSLDGLISSPEDREAALTLGRISLEAAKRVGASSLSLHPGSAPPQGSSRATVQAYVETAQRNLVEIQAMAEAMGLELLVENTSAYYLLGIKVSGQLGNDPEEMESFTGPADAPQRRMTFDTSHASTLKRVPVDGFIREMGPRIANLHLSDCNGWTDHLPIGWGKINFRKVFEALRAIGFDGNATLELRPKHSTPVELRRNRVIVETELWREREGVGRTG